MLIIQGKFYSDHQLIVIGYCNTFSCPKTIDQIYFTRMMNNKELERILTKIEVLTFELPKEWREKFKPILAECQKDLTARILIEQHNNQNSE